jgi:DNA-binding transcriptional LysR family regulator
MDLRQLAALCAIADHGSFSGAARALITVQSNVSAHVARLEKELGVSLVDRARGGLTPAGDLVVARAREIQRELVAIQADLASHGAEVAGEAHIGVIGTTARWLVPRVLLALQEIHPLVRAIVVDSPTSALLPLVQTGQLDAVIVNLPVDEPDLDAVALFEEDLVLLAPTGHPLAGRPELRLADLVGHRLLLPAPGTALRQDVDAGATRAGVTLTARAEIDGVRLMASLTFEGLGPAIVPASAVPGWFVGDFTRARIVDLAPRYVGLVRRRRRVPSAPAQAVAEVLIDVVATEGPTQVGVHVLVGPASP